MTFADFFRRTTGNDPWPWQLTLGTAQSCHDRLLRIPTGFGKTAGTVIPWLFHRVSRRDPAWPTRLAFCLPMRVLVEQTVAEIQRWLATSGLADAARVHTLMGGVETTEWLGDPERPAVLVGTQDMLLSRALMRGYASGRARWPMEFGLLHQDTLWVLDEIQLMSVGLATSTQLAAFRSTEQARQAGLKPARTWWMSATLQPNWLGSVDFAGQADSLAASTVSIPKAARSGGLFTVSRRLEREAAVEDPTDVATLARKQHQPGSVTLVIVNTVKRANAVFDALVGGKRKKAADDAGPDVRLVHSRFRGADRRRWRDDFLSRSGCAADALPKAGRIIVATQVVEAGVDISAARLVTDLAPWPSLVQRMGRCARYPGEAGTVIVVGEPPDEPAPPYSAAELIAAAAALDALGHDASPASLEAFEESLDRDTKAALFPFAPRHVLRRKDLDDLFDTSADLAGADLDIGRFIRDGDERDVSVFWREVDPSTKRLLAAPPQPNQAARPVQPQPSREELCPAPLFGDEGFDTWRKDHSAWVYDYAEREWVLLKQNRRAAPGSIVMLCAAHGGYDPQRGWAPKSKAAVPVVAPSFDAARHREALASSGEEDDAWSQGQWRTVAEHGDDVGKAADAIATSVDLPPRQRALLALAGRWHDAGKAHEGFQKALKKPEGTWAKAPRDAWVSGYEPRGLRHELASTLMLFEALRRFAPTHAAVGGDIVEDLRAVGEPVPRVDPITESALLRELAELAADEFDLVAYLVCSHHGKVRCQLSPGPYDVERGQQIRGVREGDTVPQVEVMGATRAELLPALTLHLDPATLGLNARYGRSWMERVAGLRASHGPFGLAYLEALLRAADWRASSAVDEPKGGA